MLIHFLNPETERRDGEETGARTTCEKLAEVKVNFVFASFNSHPAYHRMVKLPIRAKSAFRYARERGFNAPNLDTQALRRTPARDIDSMNGYSAGHLFCCSGVARLPGPGR